MFLSITENRTGESHLLRRIAPNESKTAREYATQWAQREYDGYNVKISFSETGSYIPNGCGDYQVEIRDTKAESGSCWESEPFYLEISD